MKKFWNLVILVLAAILVFQLYQGGKFNDLKKSVMALMMPTNTRLGPEETKTVVPAATPVFAADSGTATPEASAAPIFAATSESTPQPEAAAPTPSAEVATPKPSATPAEIDLSSIDRRYWPRLVKLNKDIQFSILGSHNELVGQVAAPAGVMVKLLEVRGTKLVVAMATGSAPQPVDAADTDIQERLREIMKVVGGASSGNSMAPVATPAPAMSASSPFVPKLNDRGRTPFQRR